MKSTLPPSDDAIDRELIALVSGLLEELGTAPGRRLVRSDSLDRDLGIGSLERVELLLRIEQAFGVRLADETMSAADTVGDLGSAVRAGAPRLAERAPTVAPAPSPGLVTPASARSLVEVLAWQAERNPERTHVFLRSDDGEEHAITYGALWSQARVVAAVLQEEGLAPGQTVALMLRTEEGFFASFFGALLAGGVPVPIYPPFRLDRLEEYAERQTAILRNAEASLLVTFAAAARVATLLRHRVASLREVVLLEGRDALPAAAFGAAASDPALIQYTSGSTGQPKGVLLSHANLLANIRAIGDAVGWRPDDVGVSWLPLYHDMGLIGTWLTALYYGLPIAILSPLAFLARPSRWLWTLHAHRGTVSPAPNFAYELCARRIPDGDLEGLDLGSWRLAFNGSEAVSPATIERFMRRFAPYGFRARALCPVYGLAEASVALTVPPVERGPWIDRISRDAFQTSRRALPAPPDDASALSFVSCGRALPGHEVRVVGAERQALGERVEGRIEFRGPSVTAGYYRQPEVTQRVLHDGWMDSGDLGYVAEGELFVTGRQKDTIKKAGRNLYPEEVEEVAGDVPGIRKGCVAAFGVPDPALGTERLVVVAETRATERAARDRMRASVVDRVTAALGIPPDTVVVAAPGSVRKTSSGKIRRSATRDAYVQGALEARGASAVRQRIHLVIRDLAARARRAVQRGRELAFALWAGVVLLVVLPSLWVALRLARSKGAADRAVRRSCRIVLRACFCPVRVRGAEHLDGIGPVVLCANHASYLDSLVLLAALAIPVRIVAKRELLARPLIGLILRKAGHLAVERLDVSRSVEDARAVAGTLRAGESLLVFPEGTFGEAPGLLPFRLGAFKAAVEVQRPVVPVGIAGTRTVLDGMRLRRPGTLEVTVGPPIEPRGGGWPEMVRLRDATRARIAALTGERMVAVRPRLA